MYPGRDSLPDCITPARLCRTGGQAGNLRPTDYPSSPDYIGLRRTGKSVALSAERSDL
ncbi:MAG: hypothetical protein IID16_13040 [Candidatus Marinimicrobia bacterium]|nr:hypothetical protein [Candidatus Neomarinimicrobiota bacterium]